MKNLIRIFLLLIIVGGAVSIHTSCSDENDCSLAGRPMMYCTIYTIDPDNPNIALKDTLDSLTITALGTSTSWNYQYSLNSVNDNNTYTRYYNFRLEGYVDLPLGIQLRTDGAYTFRNGTNIRKGEDDEILWNASATWRFLKKKEAELSAHWVDILGKRKSYNRMATSDGFYEYRTQEIKGYFIVTFKYNFRLMM